MISEPNSGGAVRHVAMPIAAPAHITVRDQGRCLELAWPDGARDLLPAPRLRAACRCAVCTAERRAHRQDPAHEAATVSILTAEQIGNYALNVGFSDGHARGIYPWRYLQALATDTPLAELLEREFR